jgi:hypothetical protein
MKSELKEIKSQNTPKFPALYESVVCGAIALFTEDCVGTVVKESKYLELGYHDEYFINCTAPEYWQRLPSGSQVILTQE